VTRITALVRYRTWACLDGATGTVGSAKSPRRWGGLLSVAASYRDGEVVVRLGDRAWPAGDPAADAALSAHLGRPVRLSREVPAGARLHRLMLDAPADPPPGTELRIGDVVLRVLVPTPRCVVPTLAHGPVPASRAVLAALPRLELPGMGRAVCFGGYAEVVEPGTLRAGQAVR